MNNQFNVISIFVVEECEPSINLPNIIHHNEHDEPDELEAATDCDESDNCDDNEYVVSSDDDSNRLEKHFTQKKRDINDKLTGYKELDRSIIFKDIAEARKVINMYALANGILQGGGVEFRTLNSEYTCEPTYENHRVNAKTIAAYFKRGFQDDPKIKVREMRASLKATYNVNFSEAKCKRRFRRMYICFHAMKMGFMSGVRPFIGLDGTSLKGKVKGQLLVAVGQDSANHFYPLAWAIVVKETKVTWN
uniref:MULE transposase domain-containing protein n=1 Tax=Nicotiana tabacum TaxID=4097 RepID=A0A1S3ZHL3_TOBAC|nr:PREDICTED: uncharacterized protein LOC107786747 [Nicotiana tabacum]